MAINVNFITQKSHVTHSCFQCQERHVNRETTWTFQRYVTSGLGYALGNTTRACCSTLTRYNYIHVGFILADLSDLFETVCCKFSSAQCKQLPFYVTTRLIENKLRLNVTFVTEGQMKVKDSYSCSTIQFLALNKKKKCNEKWRFLLPQHFRFDCELLAMLGKLKFHVFWQIFAFL